jgi:hypothetical protein
MNRNKTEQAEKASREARELAGRIAGLARPEVPEQLLAQVMARIGPKKPSLARRFWRRAGRLFRAPGLGLAAGGLAAVTLVLGLWGGAYFFRPPAAPEGSPAGNTASAPVGWRLAAGDSGRTQEVTFVARMPGARQVAVIGSFNDWLPGRHVMRKTPGSDVFTLTVALPKGRYVYAFLVDGTVLKPDAGALLQEDDGFGNTNSVLVIEDEADRRQVGGQHGRPL